MNVDQALPELTAAAAPTPKAASGYRFVGWLSNDTTPVLYAAGDRISLSKDTTLTDVWMKDTLTSVTSDKGTSPNSLGNMVLSLYASATVASKVEAVIVSVNGVTVSSDGSATTLSTIDLAEAWDSNDLTISSSDSTHTFTELSSRQVLVLRITVTYDDGDAANFNVTYTKA